MNKRTEQALNVLAQGGQFRYALERNYHGREQFKARLIDAQGQTVKGVSYATLADLKDAGMVRRDFSMPGGSTARETYVAA
jgi:uncharacterized protein YjhX (UPF0386 family)